MKNKQLEKIALAAGYGLTRWQTTEEFERFLTQYGELIVRQCATLASCSKSSSRMYEVFELEGNKV